MLVKKTVPVLTLALLCSVGLSFASQNQTTPDLKNKVVHASPANKDGKLVDTSTYKYMKQKLSQNVDYFSHYQLRIASNIQDEVLSSSKAKSMTVSSIIDDVAQQSGSFRVYINKENKIVAIASTEKQAKALAKENRDVYYVIEGQSLKQTIERWARYNGYSVVWNAEDDYKIQANAVVFGEFKKPYGALDQLLQSFQTNTYPLKATFRKNNVLIIDEDSYSSKFLTPQSAK